MKALALISGGLDSALAAYIIKKQGIEVLGLAFRNSFTSPDIGVLGRSLGISIRIIDLSQEFLDLVKNPRYGFGKNANPCIDCHIFMLKKAKDLLEKEEASFIITGEVLGQRPMSQGKNNLRLVEKQSGLQGLLLRPLSAKLLPETLVEANGWVKRDELMAIEGRGRKEQLALAEKIGLKGFGAPAGGCLLTDPGFSKRLKDLLLYDKNFTLKDIELLKLGRHFRLDESSKLIVARDVTESSRLEEIKEEGDIYFVPQSGFRGPEAVLRTRNISPDILGKAEEIIAYYYQRYNKGKDKIGLLRQMGEKKEIIVLQKAADQKKLESWMLS